MGVTEADLLEEMDLSSVECLNQVRARVAAPSLSIPVVSPPPRAPDPHHSPFAPSVFLDANRPRARTGATP